MDGNSQVGFLEDILLSLGEGFQCSLPIDRTECVESETGAARQIHLDVVRMDVVHIPRPGRYRRVDGNRLCSYSFCDVREAGIRASKAVELLNQGSGFSNVRLLTKRL